MTAAARACSASAAEIRAGTTLTSRMPCACWFSATGQVTTEPSKPRATTTDSSSSSGSSRSSTQGCAPSCTNAARASSRRRHPRLALAVVAQPAALENPGQQRRHAAASRSCARWIGLIRRDLEPDRREKLLLGDAILRHRDAVRRRAHDAVAGQEAQRFGRNILELGGGRRAPRRQLLRAQPGSSSRRRCARRRRCRPGCGCRDRARPLCSPCSEPPW